MAWVTHRARRWRNGRPAVRGLATAILAAVFILSVTLDAKAIEDGYRVRRGLVDGTGAVYLLLNDTDPICSGMLVTPRWILTAAHCRRAVRARLGNKDDPERLEAPIEAVRIHPNSRKVGDELILDVALMKLATPLYPRRADGRRWEDYRRDIYRGSARDLDDMPVDVYGYGATEKWDRDSQPAPKGDGFLRFGRFEIVAVEDFEVHMDSRDGGAEAKVGDSGASALTPGHSREGIRPAYRIVAVLSQTVQRIAWDDEVDGPHAPVFKSWFDDVVGDAIRWRPGASSIMTAIGQF